MVRDDKYDGVSDGAALSDTVSVSVGLGVTDVVRLADASFVSLELPDVVAEYDMVVWCPVGLFCDGVSESVTVREIFFDAVTSPDDVSG